MAGAPCRPRVQRVVEKPALHGEGESGVSSRPAGLPADVKSKAAGGIKATGHFQDAISGSPKNPAQTSRVRLNRCGAQQIMADTPSRSIFVAEKVGCREEEQAPAAESDPGVAAINVVQYAPDLLGIGVIVAQPVERRALVVTTVPEPFLLDGKDVGEVMDKSVARHGAPGEEMLAIQSSSSL